MPGTIFPGNQTQELENADLNFYHFYNFMLPTCRHQAGKESLSIMTFSPFEEKVEMKPNNVLV